MAKTASNGASKAFRQALLETIPCAVYLVDTERRVTYWNRAAEELTGYSRQEMLGAPCETIQSLLSREPDPEITASLCPFSEQGRQWDEECDIRRKDGRTVPVVRKARPVRNQEGTIIGGIQTMMDIRFLRETQQELTSLRAEVARFGRMGPLVGNSGAMRTLLETIAMVADTDAGVVIEGETGTGKELIARTIHQRGPRRNGPFVPVNCGALPETLIEAELFGHVRGAFTGAVADRPGRFEDADGGTLLLDEVGELPAAAQVKLLRVLQERELSRVGESKLRPVDVRIIAATNRSLDEEMQAGRFREDLFYRLRVVPIHVPSLRDRREDIPDLARVFLDQYNRRYDRGIQSISPEAMTCLEQYPWPGNVRQLQHAIEHAFVVTPSDARRIDCDALPPELREANPVDQPMTRSRSGTPGEGSEARSSTPGDEAEELRRALRACNGNKSAAARALGLTRAGLYKKLKRLGL